MLNEAPRKKKQEKPEDRMFQQKLDLNSCLQQAFIDLKWERNQHGWNQIVEELKGVTLRRLGTDGFELTYHRYFTGHPQDAQNFEKESKKFLDDVVKELKKHFKKLSGKVLEISKKDEKSTLDKTARLYADSQSLYGSTVYGGVIGKFLLAISRTYHIDAPKPETGTPGKKPVWG